MSRRQSVMSYLQGRITKAWGEGQDAEARDCLRFLEALEEMTDAEYISAYHEEETVEVSQ